MSTFNNWLKIPAIWISWVLLASALAALSSSFYLPGIAPVDYEEGAELEVFANKLTSPINKIPYDYFALRLCKKSANKEKKKKRLNLGQYLIGERAYRTGYVMNMRVNSPECNILCSSEINSAIEKKLTHLIKDKYNIRLNLDNMPLVTKFKMKSGESIFNFGYPLGTMTNDGKPVLFNHLNFIVYFHQPEFTYTEKYLRSNNNPVYRVVGFEVEPASVQQVIDNGAVTNCEVIKSEASNQKETSITAKSKPAYLESDKVIHFTYSVEFKESPLRWATRWDPLLKPTKDMKQIQWFTISNSFMIAVFLSGVVAIIILRTVHQDFNRYNHLDTEDVLLEESGWKLVHGDVFRPPPRAGLLAVLYGCGAHILWMFTATLLFAVAGFLSPANRGGLLTSLIMFFVVTSFVPGYASIRLYTFMGGKNRTAVTWGVALFFSGLAFSIFFVMNIIMWFKGSQGAIPFLTFVLILFLWIGLSVPFAFVGSYVASKRKEISVPTRTNHIPREIPPPPLNISTNWYPLMSGAVPFCVVYIELVFIMSSLWQNRVFYMFGFLFLIFMLLVICCIEISIVFTYIRLTWEDYDWWWGAFSYNATLGFYIFLYSIFYYVFHTGLSLSHHLISTLLYFGYMYLICTAVALMTGFIGFFASWIFVMKIYSSIRVD